MYKYVCHSANIECTCHGDKTGRFTLPAAIVAIETECEIYRLRQRVSILHFRTKVVLRCAHFSSLISCFLFLFLASSFHDLPFIGHIKHSHSSAETLFYASNGIVTLAICLLHENTKIDATLYKSKQNYTNQSTKLASHKSLRAPNYRLKMTRTCSLFIKLSSYGKNRFILD